MVNYSEPIKKAIVANSVSSASPEGSGALVNICCPDRLRGGPGRCRPHPGPRVSVRHAPALRAPGLATGTMAAVP